MPCNLAVTITKAVTAPAHLQALLTGNIVKSLLEGFITQHPDFKAYQPIRVTEELGGVAVYFCGIKRLFVKDGQVSAMFPSYDQARGEQLAQLVTTLLEKGADRLYAQEVKGDLARKFGEVSTTRATAKNGEEVVPVTVFKFNVSL